jgi:glycerol-3-phosphate cytidylyltransferase-like family protein
VRNVIIELLKKHETDITDINHSIYAAATAITEAITKVGKRVKNIRNKRLLENKNAKTSKCRKELSLAKSGTDSDNNELNIKREFSEILK